MSHQTQTADFYVKWCTNISAAWKDAMNENKACTVADFVKERLSEDHIMLFIIKVTASR